MYLLIRDCLVKGSQFSLLNNTTDGVSLSASSIMRAAFFLQVLKYFEVIRYCSCQTYGSLFPSRYQAAKMRRDVANKMGLGRDMSAACSLVSPHHFAFAFTVSG